MEKKYCQLNEEHAKVIEEYELKIMRLESDLEELRGYNISKSRSSSGNTQDTTSFDEALRLQLA
jgi:hypothetical protein